MFRSSTWDCSIADNLCTPAEDLEISSKALIETGTPRLRRKATPRQCANAERHAIRAL